MAILPQKLPLDQMQTKWAAEIDPVLKNPATNPILLQGVVLAAGTNLVDHRLGKKLIGWQIVRIRAAATIYDTQDTNPHPDRTLRLVSSAPVTVDLLVF
jgi:hypothetical protein